MYCNLLFDIFFFSGAKIKHFFFSLRGRVNMLSGIRKDKHFHPPENTHLHSRSLTHTHTHERAHTHLNSKALT